MEASFRVLTLGRSTRRGVSASVESGLGPNDEFTHISVYNNMHPPQLRVKIKYPPEVDDASPTGMLSTCDSDEIFDKIHQVKLHHHFLSLWIIIIFTFSTVLLQLGGFSRHEKGHPLL